MRKATQKAIRPETVTEPGLERHSILEPALKELAEQSSRQAAAVVTEVPFQGQFVIRALEDTGALSARLKPVFGLALDETPNKADAAQNNVVFWLREGQWLVVTPPEHSRTLFAQADEALDGMDSSIVDNTDGHTMLRLSGERARDILMKGCPLDIHPREFPAGSMAQTRIVHADVLLHHPDDKTFHIFVRNSFAEYLLRWIFDAGLEYGISVKKEISS